MTARLLTFEHLKKRKEAVEEIQSEIQKKKDVAAQSFCYFCLRQNHEVEALIQANDIAICNRCVEKCSGILEDNFPTSKRIGSGWILNKTT